MSNRLDQEREERLQPTRIEFAIKEIEKLGYKIVYKDKTKVIFDFKDSSVTIYPYSGWFTGKTVQDGRGLQNLLNQLK